MRVLITGGAGFVGSHTVDLLISHGHTVAIVDNFSTGSMENINHVVSPNMLVFNIDITNFKLLDGMFDTFRPDAVIHLAAQSAISTAWKNPKKDARVNIIGTLNMLELSDKYDTGKFVFASTSAVYTPYRKQLLSYLEAYSPTVPATPYGISKLAAENYIRAMFDNHVILRYGNVYGARQRSIGENQVIARAFDHFMRGANFSVHGHGKQKRDFVYVTDIARANVMAAESNVSGVFNCASGDSVSVNDVLREVEKAYDVKYNWEHTQDNDPRGSVYMNCGKIRRELMWQAEIGIEEGIHLTADWWEDWHD